MLTKLIDILLILLLAFLPLALGAMHTWSITLFAIAAVLLFNLAVFQPDFSFKKLFRFPIVIVSAVFLAYLIFQLIPLPQAILNAVSANTYKFYSEYSFTYASSGVWRPLSVYPWLTISELIKIISYGMVFIVILYRSVSTHAHEEERRMGYLQLGCLTGILAILLHSFVDFNLHVTANAFYFTVLLGLTVAMTRKEEGIDKEFIFKIVNAIIIAIFSIVHKLSGSERIYWLIKKDGDHFGPYVNYDHYAGFMSMCASLAIASFMSKVRFSSFFLIKGVHDKLLWFSSEEASHTMRHFFYAIIMAGSIFYSSSRGGIMSFIMAMLVFLFFVIIRAKKKRKGRLVLFFILITLLSGVIACWIGPDATLARFKQLNKVIRSIIHEPSVLNEMRPEIWQDTKKIIKDFPVTGTGLGTFSSIFPKYRSHEWGGRFLRYAHSDYLQLVSETGIMGIIFIIGFLAYFVRLYILTSRKLN